MTARDYRTEFPDYDDTIPEIPGMVDQSWKNEAMPCFDNTAASLRLWCDYKDPKLSQEPFNELRHHGQAKRFSLLSADLEDSQVEPVGILETDSFDEVLDAYAAAWLKWVATEGIGMGFHPDTPCDQYEPPLEGHLAEQYDDMIAFVFSRLEDPYRIGLEAWEEAGMLPTPKPAG